MTGHAHPVPRADDLTLDWVIQRLSLLTGLARESMRLDRLASACRKALSSGVSVARFLRGVEVERPEVISPLLEAACVSETYFFRQPAHFDWLTSEFAPRWSLGDEPVLRVWSAGCATGEEAWSLAGALLGALRSAPGRRVEVLATDLLDASLEYARAGRYELGAFRGEPSARCTDVGLVRQGRFEVHEALREIVRFERHNLLCAPPRGGFHLIFCRNVLVYFTRSAAQRALENLTSALHARDGVLVLGPTDVGATPSNVEGIGSPALCAFRCAPVPGGAQEGGART